MCRTRIRAVTRCGRSRRRGGCSPGFTLIEIIVALGVLTLGATGLMYLATMATSGNTRSKDDAVALALAMERMENLKGGGYEALPASTDASFDGTYAPDGSSGGIYSRSYQVSGEYLVAGIPARDIDVWVSWTGGGYAAITTRIVKPTESTVGFPDVLVRSWNQTK